MTWKTALGLVAAAAAALVAGGASATPGDWTTTFENTPQNSETPRLGAQRIRETRTLTGERGEIEHNWRSGNSPDDGRHRPGSARTFLPSGTDACSTVTSLDQQPSEALDDGRLCVTRANDSLWYYDAVSGQWESVFTEPGIKTDGEAGTKAASSNQADCNGASCYCTTANCPINTVGTNPDTWAGWVAFMDGTGGSPTLSITVNCPAQPGVTWDIALLARFSYYVYSNIATIQRINPYFRLVEDGTPIQGSWSGKQVTFDGSGDGTPMTQEIVFERKTVTPDTDYTFTAQAAVVQVVGGTFFETNPNYISTLAGECKQQAP